MKAYGQTLPGGPLNQSSEWARASLPLRPDEPRRVAPKPLRTSRVEATPMPTGQRDQAIRVEFSEGVPRSELARRYGLSRPSISRILDRGTR